MARASFDDIASCATRDEEFSWILDFGRPTQVDSDPTHGGVGDTERVACGQDCFRGRYLNPVDRRDSLRCLVASVGPGGI